MSRKENQSVAHRRSVGHPLEEQRRDDTLPREEDTIGQEHAKIRIAGARDPAGVLHPDLTGETSGDHEEVGVHDRRAASSRRVPPLMLLDSISATRPPRPSATSGNCSSSTRSERLEHRAAVAGVATIEKRVESGMTERQRNQPTVMCKPSLVVFIPCFMRILQNSFGIRGAPLQWAANL